MTSVRVHPFIAAMAKSAPTSVSAATAESAKLRQRAEIKVAKAQSRQILAAMKKDYRIVSQIFDFTLQLQPGGDEKPLATHPGNMHAKETAIPAKYHSWHYVSLTWLQRVISGIEPTACDIHRLRQLGSRGARQGNKYTLLKFLEQAVNEKPSTPIGIYVFRKKLRQLRNKYYRRGRPLSLLVLPKYDEDKNGLFAVRKATGKAGTLELYLKFPRKGVELSIPIPNTVPMTVKPSMITFLDNFSETDARMMWPRGPKKGLNCKALMLQAGLDFGDDDDSDGDESDDGNPGADDNTNSVKEMLPLAGADGQDSKPMTSKKKKKLVCSRKKAFQDAGHEMEVPQVSDDEEMASEPVFEDCAEKRPNKTITTTLSPKLFKLSSAPTPAVKRSTSGSKKALLALPPSKVPKVHGAFDETKLVIARAG